jgi:hypothetical protein
VADDELDQVWRPARWSQVGAWAVGLAGGVMSVASLVAAVTGAEAGPLVGVVGFGLFPVVAWRWGTHSLLATSADGVVVRNPVRTVVVPWTEIERCVPSSLGLIIERHGGAQPIVAWAVPKPNVSRWLRRRTRADDVAAALEERAAAAQPS